MTERSTIDRRTYLKAAAGVTTAGVLAGCTDNAEEPADDPAVDDGVTTVLVGPEGQNIFEPEELTIDAGTTVQWVWESDTHNLALVEGPDGGWEGYDEIEDDGFEYEHTFEVEGTYEYVCEPHEALDMFGTIIVR